MDIDRPAVAELMASVAAAVSRRAATVTENVYEVTRREIPELHDDQTVLALFASSIDSNVTTCLQIMQHQIDLADVHAPAAAPPRGLLVGVPRIGDKRRRSRVPPRYGAASIPVSLQDAASGIDDHNVATAGHRDLADGVLIARCVTGHADFWHPTGPQARRSSLAARKPRSPESNSQRLRLILPVGPRRGGDGPGTDPAVGYSSGLGTRLIWRD